MEFVHHHYQPGETIAAIATPPGEGGVAIIRISGNRCPGNRRKSFFGPRPHIQIPYSPLRPYPRAQTRHVDDVLNHPNAGHAFLHRRRHRRNPLPRRQPDHPSRLRCGPRRRSPRCTARRIHLQSFINGKIDLAQAEAVQELIGAKNERALDAAEEQLQGTLIKKNRKFQNQLTQIAAILEAWVDFPEEGLEFASMEEICDELERD